MELSPNAAQTVEKKPILTTEGLIQPTSPAEPITSTPLATTTTTATTASGTTTTTTTTTATASTTSSSSSSSQLTVDQLEIEILPVIYDTIRCVEKDPVDNTAKQRESQECIQKILDLQKRFESARDQIKQLPGVDYNKEEQLQKLELLQSQLKLKQQLIEKYKDTVF